MNNELSKLPNFSVDFTPSEIKIANVEALEAAVNEISRKFNGIVFTNVKDAKEARATLRKFKKALDDRRKEIKRAYNQPYNDFNAVMKRLESTLDESIEPIDNALKEQDEYRREAKVAIVNKLIYETAPNYGVDVNEIVVDPKWLNKTTSKKTILDGIVGQCNAAVEQHSWRVVVLEFNTSIKKMKLLKEFIESNDIEYSELD